MLVIPVPKRLRQGYHKLDASFGYLVEPCLKNKTKYRIYSFLVLSLQSLQCDLEEEFDRQHQHTLQVLKKRVVQVEQGYIGDQVCWTCLDSSMDCTESFLQRLKADELQD